MIKNKIITINTNKEFEIKNLTELVREFVKESNVSDGIITIFSRHTTAAVTLIEDEENLIKDYKSKISEIVEPRIYNHDKLDGNARAHLRTSLLGQSVTIPIINNKIMLGTWQNVMFIEFDIKKRTRTVILQIVGDLSK